MWNLAGLAILYFIIRPRRKFDGQLFLTYFLWYGLGRVWIEGLRTDSLYFFQTGIRVSQALAGIFAVTALAMILVRLRRQGKSPKPLYIEELAAKQAEEAQQKQEKE